MSVSDLHKTAILPPACLGMLGGGQLGRFFVIAAHEMGYRVKVLDPDPHSPAGRIADEHLIADYSDPDALNQLAQTCSAVTTEFENVPAATLSYLAKFIPAHPSAAAVAICQNRSEEKQFLRKHGFPHAPYADVRSAADIEALGISLFPAILKVARFGYDGKGQARVSTPEEALAAYQRFKGEACVLEKMLILDAEISVVLARERSGAAKCFPPVENKHRDGILDRSVSPGQIPLAMASEAQAIAHRIADTMNYVGTMAVEFFVIQGQLFVNEMAPRPHNSGHFTLDACIVNQFEQQVRALTGLPLGDGAAHSQAIMVNLLGDLWFRDDSHHSHEPDWAALLAIPNLKLHLYGKHHARPGRKMGHFTVVGNNPNTVKERELQARLAIGLLND